MENYYELEDITLIPSVTNNGHLGNTADYSVTDPNDQTGYARTLPIFTSPSSAIIGKENIKDFVDHGIKPVIPACDPLTERLELCQWVFCAFSMNEVKAEFLNRNRIGGNTQYHICIDSGNGHDQGLINLCGDLKRMYGAQVIVMGGNIGTPEVYSQYARAGFDYMRVGIASGSQVDRGKYGFHYPTASLLEGIKNFKKTGGITLPKQVKIVADGGITCPSDIIKAIALGADYVMIGRDFARVIEAYGPIYKCSKTKSGDFVKDEIDPSTVRGMDGVKAKLNGFSRMYYGNTSPEARAMRAGFQDVESWRRSKPRIKVSDTAWEWIEINANLDEWCKDFEECAYYAFMMTGTRNWNDFKNVIRYGVL